MKAPKSELISRAGVHYAGYVFSTEGVIFRETSSTDVGIDGQIELVSPDGEATGTLVGVQIKSGDSFVDNNAQIFSFKASKKHFSYWQNLRMPAIGIVYSPTLKVASWFDLTKHAEDILTNNKPPIIRQKLNQQNTIKIGNKLNHLIELTHIYYKLPVSKNDIEKLASILDAVESEQCLKEESWKRLITVFFASDSDSEIIGDVGHRLSWYFPTVSDTQKLQFKNRLQQLTHCELVRIFKAIKLAMEQNRDDVVSHVVDLLSYNSNVFKMLDHLYCEGLVTSEDMWLVDTLKELITEL
jgi:hypothetical protein